MICSCLLQSGQNDSDSSVMAQTSEYGQCCELAYKKDLMKWMETLPQCDFFVNGNREGQREKTRGKENVHSLKGDEDTYMAMELPKTSKQAWKHCPRRHCILRRRMRRMFVGRFFFFLSSTPRRYFKELLLPLHSLPPFPKHDKQMKEPSKGRWRLGSPLSFYLPSPHTSLLRSSPTTWLKSAP